MGTIYKSHGPIAHGSPKKVFIAIPSYGDLCAGFVASLLDTQTLLTSKNIAYEIQILSGACHIDDARNQLARDFLESDCTDLFFIDADLTWNADDFVSILMTSKDVVGATYRFKREQEAYPVKYLGAGDLYADREGLIQVAGVPTGLLKINRAVLEYLYSESKKHKPATDSSDRLMLPVIFERIFDGDERLGGDYAFCKKWRDLGGYIYLYPMANISHVSTCEYNGTFGKWLKHENKLLIPEILNKITNKSETAQDIVDLYTRNDNNYASKPDLLAFLIDAARCIEPGGSILEFGSGLSSLAMAAANPGVSIYAVEHDDVHMIELERKKELYALENLTIVKSKIKDKYYDTIPGGRFDMVISDGPPRQIGRLGFIQHGLCKAKPGAMVVIDDIDHEMAMRMPLRLEMSVSGVFAYAKVGSK